MLAGPPHQHCTYPMTWPRVEMTWDLIGSNLYMIHSMALIEFTQLQISANERKKGTLFSAECS